MKEFLIITGIIIGFLFASLCIMVLIAYPFEKMACHSKWADRHTEFGLFSGCQVEAPDGTMIPSKNFRILD